LQYTFEAIGTHWIIDVPEIPAPLPADSLLEKIQDRIEQFDLNYSRFRPDSLVTKMSQQAGTYKLPEDAKLLLDAYQQFYKVTGGAVTPLIGNTMEQAGYDANYSLVSGELTPLPTWEEVINYHYPNLEISRPVMLDFGAAGKGYLIDIIGQLLRSVDIHSFCIDAGGDMLQHTATGEILEVGLENPDDTSEAIGIAKIRNQSLCASSGNRRRWEGFHHIIDPRTLTSPKNILATWTVAETSLLADGLATCLFFTPPTQLESHFRFEYLILYKDRSIGRSEQFPAEIFFK
jgi:thiamine biosynthesis lipoprotein